MTIISNQVYIAQYDSMLNRINDFPYVGKTRKLLL